MSPPLPAAFDTRYFSILIVRGDDHSTAVIAGIGHVTQLRIDRNGQWRRWQHWPVTTRTGDYWITQDSLHRAGHHQATAELSREASSWEILTLVS